MGLYKRGRIFWFSTMYQGRRIQESLETGNKRLAEKVYAKKLMDIMEGRHLGAFMARKIVFEEMVSKYLAEHAHSRDPYTVKRLRQSFNGYTLSEISTRIVAEHRTRRLQHVKPATVYQELALLRRMFNVAIREWEWLQDNPVSRLSFSVGSRNARDRWLTPKEENALLACATNPRWLRTLLIVALHTGMRQGEILNLKWQEIDFDKKIILVSKSKNGAKRSVPMTNTLCETLKNVQVRGISGRVFPIAIRSLRVAFGKTLKKAAIENFHFHDLRHTFATRLVQNGVDLYKVKELLGHKTLAMTTRYAHHYPESLRTSVEVLDNCYKFATSQVGAIDR
ncbi:MAG TPA: site-specific integrase [Syntrophorhabdaceae bacterium]|nr:site-specific integrase [Syntrophorhabdaceae bacterium]